MSYKLEKPYTDKQRMDFIVEYNHNQGLKIEEVNNAFYALEANEIIVDGIPQIDPEYEARKLQEEQEAKSIETKQDLATLDQQSIRSIRAILSGEGTEEDTKFLSQLELQAKELRKGLSNGTK